MRIIGGALRGRRLQAAPGPATRPTSDRVREAVASALEARGLLIGARVLDAFAGTGALGLEAISRGAASVLAVDQDRRAAQGMRQNADALGVQARVQVLELDLLAPVTQVVAALERSGLSPFQLVFVDPPYTLVQVAAERLAELAAQAVFSAGAVVVLEHAARTTLERPARFAELAKYRYGDTAVELWETIAAPDES